MESTHSPTYLPGLQPVANKILIVEDEKATAEEMKHALSSHGYELKVATRPSEALAIAQNWQPHVAVLDVELPEMDGVTLCQRLKECAGNPLVIFVTSHSNKAMRRQCLKAGDDYITKPFDGEDLALRVETRIRRQEMDRGNPQGVKSSPPAINPAGGPVKLPGGRAVELTPTEARLFNALLERDGGTVTRATLMREVWGGARSDIDNILDVFIGRLRKAIERDASRPRIILTLRRCGYRIDMDELRRAR